MTNASTVPTVKVLMSQVISVVGAPDDRESITWGVTARIAERVPPTGTKNAYDEASTAS